MIADLDDRDAVRFGVYLRPSFAMARAQAEIHDLVARQFGSNTAGRFMPHATIKGFFRSEASIPEIVAALNPELKRIMPFEVINGGIMSFGGTGSIVIDIHHTSDGRTNLQLQSLHDGVVDALLPLVDSDCAFTSREPMRDRSHAHLTLMMGDIPSGLQAEILEFLEDAENIGPPTFIASVCHLVAVRSDAWRGAWWDTMRWTLVHSWKLGEGGVSVNRPLWNTSPTHGP